MVIQMARTFFILRKLFEDLVRISEQAIVHNGYRAHRLTSIASLSSHGSISFVGQLCSSL
jgi:hypothetical protein